jgi:ABC-type enterochelin transport system ATPase subunit
VYALSSGTVIKKLIKEGDSVTKNEILYPMMNEVDQTFRVDAILSHNKEKSIITVTHDIDFAKRADRIIEIADGRIISQ